MKPSQQAIDLIKQFEGFRTNAYICPAGVPTIGYGSTMWPDGKKVKLGEVISMEQAEKLLMWEIENKTKAMKPVKVNQNQYDALVSFVYNLGVGAFNGSTLRKLVHNNPNDPKIEDEFMKWVNVRQGGKLVRSNGLVRRRQAEANLYFKEAVK